MTWVTGTEYPAFAMKIGKKEAREKRKQHVIRGRGARLHEDR